MNQQLANCKMRKIPPSPDISRNSFGNVKLQNMENMDVSRQKENVEYQRECQELRAELIHTKRELHKMNEVFERENMNFSEWNISIEDQFFNTHTESENSKTVLEQLKELSEEKSSLEIQVESLSVQLENMRNNQSKDIPLTSQLLQQEFSLLREEFNGIITTNLNMLLENDQLKKKHQIEIDINVGLIKTVQKSNEMYKELKQEHRRFKDRTHRIKDHQDDLRDLVEKLEDERRFLQDQMVLLKKNLKRSEHDAHQELQKERAWGRQMEEEANDFGKLTLAAQDRILILETENRKMMEKNTDLLNEHELVKSQHILVSNLLKKSEIEANQRIEDQKKSDATRDRWKETAKSSIEKMILANKNISEQALEIKKLKKMLQSPNPVALVPRTIRQKSGISKKADSQPVEIIVTRAMKRKRISFNIENSFEVTQEEKKRVKTDDKIKWTAEHTKDLKIIIKKNENVKDKKSNLKTSTERKNLLEKLSYACDKCDKLFLSYTVLKSHKNEKHKCFHCDDEFALSIQRINHTIRKHFKSKLYCEVPECSGKFKRKEAYLKHVLQSHQNIGTDELTFLLQKIKELRPDLQKLKYI